MGVRCCSKKHGPNSESVYRKKLIQVISKNSKSKLRHNLKVLMAEFPEFDLDEKLLKIHHIEMNPLTYSLYIGAVGSFEVLVQTKKVSFKKLKEAFLSIGKSPVDIICQMGHLDLLKYYLPFYLTQQNQSSDSEQNIQELSIFNVEEKGPLPKKRPAIPMSYQTAIQRACQKGRIDILQFFRSYFPESPPAEFDIHHIDERVGQNCALVSCKVGILQLIKFLYHDCQADFHVINKRQEGALQLMAAWSKKRKSRNFLECVKYLVQEIKIDITYEYEETLLLLQDKNIIFYIEFALNRLGLEVTKQAIDQKYALIRDRQANQVDRNLEEKLQSVRGPDFNFAEIFKEEFEESKGSISSIPYIEQN